MSSVGAFEAKTHLSALLERVARGETIAITRHGVTVAMLVPPAAPKPMSVEQAARQLREFRRGRKASQGTIKRWIREGRS